VEVWGSFRLLLVNELLERLFLFGGALQLQEHVLHRKTVCNCATVVPNPCFRTSVTGKRDAIALVDFLGDEGARMAP